MRYVSGVMLMALLGIGQARGDEPRRPFTDVLNCGFCVSKDGKRLAMNCWSVWDVSKRKCLFKGDTHGAHGINFSPDGKFMAVVGNYAEFFVYDASNGKEYWNLTLKGHGDTILKHVEFTPDSRFIVSSSINGMLRVWDVKNKKAQALFCFPSPIEDQQSNQDEYLRAWRTLAGKDRPPDDVKTFVVFKKPKIEYLGCFAISPDGKTVAVPTRTAEVLLIELATGKVLQTFETKQDSTFSVRFSADGKTLAVGGGGGLLEEEWKGTIELWDVKEAKCVRRWKGHRHSVLHLAFSPDGKTLASGGLTDGVFVWDVKTGKQKYALHQENPYDKERPISTGTECVGLAYLPDGKALLTLTDRQGDPVHFWEPKSGKRIPQPPPDDKQR